MCTYTCTRGKLLSVIVPLRKPIDGVDMGDSDDRKSLSAHEFATLADDTDATTERHQTTGVKFRNQRKSFVNIKLWVAFMTLTATFLATDAIVRYAVLTTLERRFGFTSVYNGVLVAAYDMGHVMALVVLSIVGKWVTWSVTLCFSLSVASSVNQILTNIY